MSPSDRDAAFARYHAGEETPLRQWLYDHVGVTDLARCEVDELSGSLATEVLMAKCDRLVVKGILTREQVFGVS